MKNIKKKCNRYEGGGGVPNQSGSVRKLSTAQGLSEGKGNSGFRPRDQRKKSQWGPNRDWGKKNSVREGRPTIGGSIGQLGGGGVPRLGSHGRGILVKDHQERDRKKKRRKKKERRNNWKKGGVLDVRISKRKKKSVKGPPGQRGGGVGRKSHEKGKPDRPGKAQTVQKGDVMNRRSGLVRSCGRAQDRRRESEKTCAREVKKRRKRGGKHKGRGGRGKRGSWGGVSAGRRKGIARW